MSRYRIDGPIPTSTTAHIYGPEGQVLGQIYRADDPESLRFKRFIEAHDEIIDVLSDAAYDYGDQGVNLLEMRALLDFVIKAEALIKQFDSEEAQ